MIILITFLFFFGTCFSGCVNVEQRHTQLKANKEMVPAYTPKVEGTPVIKTDHGPWQLRENKEGIPVYTRKDEGSPILEYKANAVINAPISKVVALFEDEKQISRWYFQCSHSELVEKEGPKREVIYLILHLPWPVAPRDFVFRRTKTVDPVSGITSYVLTALPNRLPLVKGMIRVNSIKSLWVFKPLPNSKTEVFFQQHTDPAGSVPVSIINQLAAQTPFCSLKSFRDLLTVKDDEKTGTH